MHSIGVAFHSQVILTGSTPFMTAPMTVVMQGCRSLDKSLISSLNSSWRRAVSLHHGNSHIASPLDIDTPAETEPRILKLYLDSLLEGLANQRRNWLFLAPKLYPPKKSRSAKA